jgi:hypothetical protein
MPFSKDDLEFRLFHTVRTVYFYRIVRRLIAYCSHILSSVCLLAHATAKILEMSSLPWELKLKKILNP